MSRFVKYTLWIIASLLLTVAIQTAWYEIRVWRGWSELYATAEQFGYMPDEEIVASRECLTPSISIPPTLGCRLLVIFRTDATLKQFQQNIENHGLDPNTNGYTYTSPLRDHINNIRHSEFTLTVNGVDGSSLQDQPKFNDIDSSYPWHRENTTIEFFDLMKVPKNIELNGEPFTQNIVIISEEMGRHSILALLGNSDNFPNR